MLGQIKQNAERSDDHDACSEEAQLKTSHAQLEFLGRNAIKPAQTGDETGKTTSGQPRLRGYTRGQSDSEIVRQSRPPIGGKEPGLRQITHQRAKSKGQKGSVNFPAEGAARWLKNQERAKESNDDSFGPFAGRATKKNRKNR